MNSSERPTRIYIGRLAGTNVFDPIGDRVGKVMDVVVLFRLRSAPLVVGLVVEVAGKRRVFMPLTRIIAIENGQVISTGLINLRRFSQRSTETLVVGEILDHQVDFKDGSGSAFVEDVAMENIRAGEWRLTYLYVRMARGAKDAGNKLITPISEVTGLASKIENQRASALISQLEGLKAPDVADVLRELPHHRMLSVANQLRDARLADVLEELGEEDREIIVAGLDIERAADVLEEMQPDDAADLVASLPSAQAEILLSRMQPDDAADVRRLMSYGERTAGGLMTTEPIVLPPDATVATALAHSRRADVPPALATMVFVCRPPLETPTGRFLGVVHLQRALREPPGTMLGDLLDTDIEPVSHDHGIGTVTRLLATYNLTAIPVTYDDILIGAVSVDDVLDHLLPTDWREYDEGVLDTAINERYEMVHAKATEKNIFQEG